MSAATLTIRVKWRHIRQGVREDCARCPIALAANEQHPVQAPWPQECGEPWRVDMFLWHRGTGEEYRLPLEAMLWMDAFDDGKRLQPITFTVTKEEATR